MKRPTVLFVSPNLRPFEFIFERFPTARGYVFPLGLAYLAAFIRPYGYEARILDAYSDDLSQTEINAVIREYAPDVVALTSPMNYQFGLDTIRAAKAIDPGIVTVLGGLTPTYMPREIMEHVPELDYIVSGEGELPLLYLLRALEGEMSFDEIRGLVHRKDRGAIIINGDRYRVENLNSLPFPAKDLFITRKNEPYFKERHHTLMEASRGCHYHCRFCAVKDHFGEGIRWRGPHSIVNELRECVEQYGIRSVFFCDSTMTADPRRIHQILDAIIQSDIHMKFSFMCSTRLDCVDPEILRKLKAANCRSVTYGVETSSQEVLDAYDKKWQLEKTRDIFNETKKAGLGAKAFLIFDQYHPAGEEAVERQTEHLIGFLRTLRPDEITLSPLIICPNSPMYDEILASGGIDRDGYQALFRKRIIPSKRMPDRAIERCLLRIYSESSFKNRMEVLAHRMGLLG